MEPDSGKPPEVTPGQEELGVDGIPEPPMRDTEEDKGGALSRLNRGLGANILVALVVALLVFAVMGMMGGGSFVTKKDFDVNMANMVITLNQAEADLEKARSTVNNAIQELPTTISTSVNNLIDQRINQVNQSIDQLSSQVSSMSNQISAISSSPDYSESISSLQQSVTQISTDLDDLQIYVLDLQDEVDDLSGTPTSTPSGNLILEVKPLSESLIPSFDHTQLLAQVKISLTNSTAFDITDVLVSLAFQTEVLPITTETSVALVSSPVMSWLTSGWYASMVEYRNGWGLSVLANKTKVIYVTLTITDPSAPFTRAYGYQLDVDVD